MKKIKIKTKHGAMELSISTVVIIVLAMSLLILGIVLVRKVMCAGIVWSEGISRQVESEIRNIFTGDDEGVICMGGPEYDAVLGAGGRRSIICVINQGQPHNYAFTLTSTTSLTPSLTNSLAEDLVIDKDFSGNVGIGKQTIRIATLNIPRDTPDSIIKLDFTVTKDGIPGTDQSLNIEIIHSGAFRASMC